MELDHLAGVGGGVVGGDHGVGLGPARVVQVWQGARHQVVSCPAREGRHGWEGGAGKEFVSSLYEAGIGRDLFWDKDFFLPGREGWSTWKGWIEWSMWSQGRGRGSLWWRRWWGWGGWHWGRLPGPAVPVMSVIPVRASPLKPVPLLDHHGSASLKPTSVSKVETAAVVWGESWKLAVDITWSPGVALELELGGSCGRLVPERPAILPFAAALPRLHSYSFPFDLHVGSNCGGGGGGSAAAQLRLNLH